MAVAPTRHCGRCLAARREAKLPHLKHDLKHHAMMMVMAKQPTSRCAVMGKSLLTLTKIGETLTVDRIDSSRGYMPDNVRLLSSSLNSAKRDYARIPTQSIKRLERKLQRVVEGLLDKEPRPHVQI
jgi:hypothetical protein